MRTEDLEYDCDPTLIAQEPAHPRDAARLLVFDRASGRVEHRLVRDLPEYLRPGDALVVNETTVAPARVKAMRVRSEGANGGVDAAPGAPTSGALVEGLLLERCSDREWLALLRNCKRVRDGERLRLIGPPRAAGTELEYGLVFVARSEGGVRVRLEGAASGDEVLAAVGWTPLPPYILQARRPSGEGGADATDPDDDDRARYQTVYARATELPSVAAPTAGLHFTPELLQQMLTRGVTRIPVELQVGAGTFKPVATATLEEHRMHRERCVVTRRALDQLTAALARRSRGARIVAVGTTSVRTLESLPELPVAPDHDALAWETDLLIQPGFRFRFVDALLTNFHLPRSTLLALVAAVLEPAGGIARLRELYALAQRERYRLYSFGDAMLIL